MKKIVYFFVFSIELTNDLVRNSEIITREIKCTFLENYSKAVFDASDVPCESIDLTLQLNDDRVFDVKKLELKTSCDNGHEWKITSLNTFKRFTKLTDLIVYSVIQRFVDAHTKGTLPSQLLNVPTITCLHYKKCVSERGDWAKDQWILPPNLSKLIFEYCAEVPINWKKTTKLKYLKIATIEWVKIPGLGFPSLQEFDIGKAENIEFTIPEIAFFCNLTKFSFKPFQFASKQACTCELLKKWQQYLETEKSPLTITTHTGALIKDVKCGTCTNDTDDILKEAKSQRAKCLSLKPPEEETPVTKKKEFDSGSWPFWVFIVAGFLIISLIFAIMMFVAERLSRRSSETEFASEDESEELEEEQEEE